MRTKGKKKITSEIRFRKRTENVLQKKEEEKKKDVKIGDFLHPQILSLGGEINIFSLCAVHTHTHTHTLTHFLRLFHTYTHTHTTHITHTYKHTRRYTHTHP